MPKMNEHTEILYGSPPRILMACFWFAFLIAVLFISLIYVFEDSSNIVVGVARFLIHAALFILAAVPFISLTILLFSWKPAVEVGNGMVRFPNIGLTLSPAEVANAIPQRSKLSEHWRVAIELQSEMPGRYRTWLLWPVASAASLFTYLSWQRRLVQDARILERDAGIELPTY